MLTEIEAFLNWQQMRNPQAKTWRDYKCDLALLVVVVGDRDVEKIHPQEIDTFVKAQIDRGHKPSTVNRRLSAVVSFYRYLASEVKTIPCPVLPRRHYLREPQRLPRPVNEQELRKFFGAVGDARGRAMFALMLYCGLRIGEVSALKLTDLYLGETPSRMIIHGKGSRERTVYLSSEAERALQTWLTQRPKARDKHVFLSYQHKRLSTTSISKRIQHVCRSGGVDLTAHRLRHSFADHLLSAGMPITSIQKLMGHRFVETTQNYAAANDRQVQADFYKACEKLDGWKLLLEVLHGGNTEGETIAASSIGQEGGHETTPPAIQIPARFALLPAGLVDQLEAYRQWKTSRWRVERIMANSTGFYSLHGRLWEFFGEQCGITDVSKLRLEHVLQFIKARLDAGRSPRTVNGSLSSLRSFLSFLKEDGVSIDPSLENIQRLKEEERLPRYISSEQVLRLRDEIEERVSRAQNQELHSDALLLRAVFYLLWQGGLRIGEVELLRFSDFYLSQGEQAKRLFIRDGKWRKGRAVYLTDVALQALKSYLAVRGVEQAGGFVFVRHGKPLQKNFLSGRLKAIGRQVEVSVTPHRLRHTFGRSLGRLVNASEDAIC